jgi:tetratricopeptide (TPR) repeat protein
VPLQFDMTKQELFKQADYTFQRGNRELAKKYLTEYLAASPNDEAAWMLMARIEEKKEGIIQCYERAIKLNPNNKEAKLGLVRIRSKVNPTLPKQGNFQSNIWHPAPASNKNNIRIGLSILVVLVLFATTSLVVARNNPESKMAQALAISTPDLYGGAVLADDIAPKTRAQIGESYPQYSQLMDALISYAVENANNGMEGAPERPGAEIMVSENAGTEAKSAFEKTLFQPGALNSVSITEQQITSWLAMGMSKNPDLPLSDVQVYLRNGKVQIWGMVNGTEESTSALIVGTVSIGNNKQPYFRIESLQIGQQVVPNLLLTQVENWANQSIQDAIEKYIPGLELMNVNVTNGMISISGMR